MGIETIHIGQDFVTYT